MNLLYIAHKYPPPVKQNMYIEDRKEEGNKYISIVNQGTHQEVRLYGYVCAYVPSEKDDPAGRESVFFLCMVTNDSLTPEGSASRGRSNRIRSGMATLLMMAAIGGALCRPFATMTGREANGVSQAGRLFMKPRQKLLLGNVMALFGLALKSNS